MPAARGTPLTAAHRMAHRVLRRAAVVRLAAQVRGHVGLLEVLLVQLLRIVEFVAVDEIAEPLDSTPHAVRGRLARKLGLVAAGNEARHHRAERPDAQARLQSVAHVR